MSKITAVFIIMCYCLAAAGADPLPATTSANSQEFQDLSLYKCIDADDKKTLSNGWYLWQPYQFNQVGNGGYKLTGMDIELTRTIAEKVGIEIKYDSIAWNRHQRELKAGQRDMASGATYTNDRAEFVNFSVPYRFEENALFILRNSDKKLIFNNIQEYVAQVKVQNFRLGATKGFVYADPKINEFIADAANSDITFLYDNDDDSLRALLRNEIDGFMADRVVGAAAILNHDAGNKVSEVPLNIKAPIHFMFSKKTVPLDIVDHFNQEIQKFVVSAEYKNIVKNYVYPVLLLQTIDSEWFYIVGLIGTIAFAISGVAIAAKDNSTLFATLLLAVLPSIGGGIMRDVLLNRGTVGIILTPSYMYYIMIVVVAGFATIRLLNYYNSDAYADAFLQKFWNNLLIVCDAMGQAAFIVTGVSIVIMMRIEPIELWGPFCAFLTSNGGGILRDLIRNHDAVAAISAGINPEISIIWGVIFSMYLDMTAYNPNPDTIEYVVIIVAVGAFITRMLVHYLKMPNIRFR